MATKALESCINPDGGLFYFGRITFSGDQMKILLGDDKRAAAAIIHSEIASLSNDMLDSLMSDFGIPKEINVTKHPDDDALYFWITNQLSAERIEEFISGSKDSMEDAVRREVNKAAEELYEGIMTEIAHRRAMRSLADSLQAKYLPRDPDSQTNS